MSIEKNVNRSRYPFMRAMTIILLSSIISSAQILQTQAEHSGFTEFTKYENLIDYLDDLAQSSSLVSIKIIGRSAENRDLPALFFSKDKIFGSNRDEKPLIMIMCQQHGDEPSGKEAALIVARHLLNQDSYLLNNLDLILLPQVNPDGSEKGTRLNANEMDLNRNLVILSEPEVVAIHTLFLEWMPEVTLDVHEYNAIEAKWVKAGYVKDAEEMLGGVTNLNIDSSIIAFSRHTFIPETGNNIDKDGFRFHRYIVGNPFNKKGIRYSTTSINDGRQSMGIYNTLSFIIEGKRYGHPLNNLEKRTRGQVSALLNFLKTVNRHAGPIMKIVQKARKDLLVNTVNSNNISIQMDYFTDSSHSQITFPIFDLYEWKHTTRDFDDFRAKVKIEKSVKKPAAYIFSSDKQELIKLLRKHQIPMHRIKEPVSASVETYKIKYVTASRDEEKASIQIDLEKSENVERLNKEWIIVTLNNRAANLIPLLFEPQSTWCFSKRRTGRKYYFKDFITEGQDYPVKRIKTLDGIALEPIN